MAGGTLAAWKLDEGLTVVGIRRRGGARLRFVGYGDCGVVSWGAEGRREARVPFVGRRQPWHAGLVWEGRRIPR